MLDYIITDSVDEEYYVVADIHADFKRLCETYREYNMIKPNRPNMKLIYLGDYLDRGMDGETVISTISYIQKHGKYRNDIYFLLGNHEVFKYKATLRVNDPTRHTNDRLTLYQKHGLKFYFGYYNVSRKLLFTHAGIKDVSNVEEFLKYHINMLSMIDRRNFLINTAHIRESLSEEATKLHDDVFYSITVHDRPFTEGVLEYLRSYNSNITQIIGHWHSVFIADNSNIMLIDDLKNIDKQNIKMIVLDTSDISNTVFRLIIDKDNNCDYRRIV